MVYVLVGHYNIGLVCLSFGTAILASYTTLSLGHRILVATGWRQWPWLCGGAVAMGTGIWATHFVAMLALEMPMPITYDLIPTGLSLVYAVLAAAVALVLVSRPGLSWLSLGGGGVVMGSAIAWMHYIGMAAIDMPAKLSYRWPLVALSVIVAVSASTVALGLTLWSRRHPHQDSLGPTNLAVVTLAIAIGGLHYTGMAGTVFSPDDLAGVAVRADAMPDLDARSLAGSGDRPWSRADFGHYPGYAQA